MKTLYVGSDHGGFTLKSFLCAELPKRCPQWKVQDLGCNSADSVDYPDFAALVGAEVSAGKGLGLLVCGTGIGMSIAANKIRGVRAAEVWDVTTARLARQHNNANILCVGGRVLGPETALDAVVAWLEAEFLGGRHQRRVDGIHALEDK